MGNLFSKKPYKFKFKKRNSFEERRKLFLKFKESNPTKIPIIIEPKFEEINVTKDIYRKSCEPNMTIGQIIYILRQSEKIDSQMGLFLVVQDKVCVTSEITLEDVYNKYKDEDGFCYFTFQHEMRLG